MRQLLFSIWFFLPAGIANASPIFMTKIPKLRNWSTPLDFGRTWHGIRILGDHKTWRGLVGGAVCGLLVIIFQILAYQNCSWVRDFCQIIYDFSWDILLLGVLLGSGALLGDSVESFFKRRAGVKPGHAWFPFDQLDYIAGGLLLSLLIVRLPLKTYLLIIVVWFGVHLLASYVGFRAGLKERPI